MVKEFSSFTLASPALTLRSRPAPNPSCCGENALCNRCMALLLRELPTSNALVVNSGGHPQFGLPSEYLGHSEQPPPCDDCPSEVDLSHLWPDGPNVPKPSASTQTTGHPAFGLPGEYLQ